MGTLIISYSGLIIFTSFKIWNVLRQFLYCYNSTRMYQHIQNLFLLVQLFVRFLFVRENDPPLFVTVDATTITNTKHSSSCYQITSVTSVKVCNSFISCQSVCEVNPIHVMLFIWPMIPLWSTGMQYPYVNLGLFPQQLQTLQVSA